MKPIIDKEKCIGCGTCPALAAKTFKMDDDNKAAVIDPHGDDTETVRSAVDACPVAAISLAEE